MTKAQYGTPDYYRGVMREIETELNDSLDGEMGTLTYAYAYGRMLGALKGCIAHLEAATASQACRPGCGRLSGHSGPCIERDLDAEVNAGKWGAPGSGLAEFVEDLKWGKSWLVGCANAIDPATWPGEPEFVNVNHE